jgi:hypothetical protein
MNAFGAGGTRESVNEIERNWHKAGWSEAHQGMIVIPDLAEIRRLADMPDLRSALTRAD